MIYPVQRVQALPRIAVWVFLLAMVMQPDGSGTEEPGRLRFPPTNRQMAEQVIAQALEKLGIPEGKGGEVSCGVEEGGAPGNSLIDILSVEFLNRHGYRVRTGDGIPGFRFGVESLAVVLKGRGVVRVSRVERHAEVSVVAVLRGTGETGRPSVSGAHVGDPLRTTWRARGVLDDAFPAKDREYVGRSEPFVNDQSGPSLSIRPIVYGLIVTGLIWLLYSYRG